MDQEKQNHEGESLDPINLPLYYIPHSPNENINYLRHSRPDWDISQLQGSIYFYQPKVKPDANGGTVQLTENEKQTIEKYLKKEFVDVRSNALNYFFNRLPDAEEWTMSTDSLGMPIPFNQTGPFKGSADALSNTNFAVIVPSKESFEISLIDQSIRITDDRPVGHDMTIDELLFLKKQEENYRLKELKKHFKVIYDHLIEREKERIQLALATNQEGGEDVIYSDAEDDQLENNEAQECDVKDVKSDDEDDLESDQEIDAIQDALDLEYDASSDSEEDNLESLETKPKPPGQLQINTKEMVNQIMGLPIVQDHEIIEFMQNSGLVTGNQLLSHFSPKLVTNEQKQAFKIAIIKLLKIVTIAGEKYFQLRGKPLKTE